MDNVFFPKPFQPDFETGSYVDLYRHMYDSTGFDISNYSCGITKEVFKAGRCFLTADLTPDRCNGFHIHPDEFGKIDIELGFKSAKDHPIYLLAYTIFNSRIKIEEKKDKLSEQTYKWQDSAIFFWRSFYFPNAIILLVFTQ